MGMDSPHSPQTRRGAVRAWDEVERSLEADESLVPTRPSALLVEPSVLDPLEVEALLADLGTLLNDAAACAASTDIEAATLEQLESGDRLNRDRADDRSSEPGVFDESHPSTARRDRGHPQLPSLAWLFPHHAGARRSARHQQGHHLRARRGPGKKAGPPPRQAQGSLFGDHLR